MPLVNQRLTRHNHLGYLKYSLKEMLNQRKRKTNMTNLNKVFSFSLTFTCSCCSKLNLFLTIEDSFVLLQIFEGPPCEWIWLPLTFLVAKRFGDFHFKLVPSRDYWQTLKCRNQLNMMLCQMAIFIFIFSEELENVFFGFLLAKFWVLFIYLNVR